MKEIMIGMSSGPQVTKGKDNDQKTMPVSLALKN